MHRVSVQRMFSVYLRHQGNIACMNEYPIKGYIHLTYIHVWKMDIEILTKNMSKPSASSKEGKFQKNGKVTEKGKDLAKF